MTTASMAGAGFGVALAWALVFSVIAKIVLQDMSARLGLVTSSGLGEAFQATTSLIRGPSTTLVVGAIAFGNAAFQTANVAGADGGVKSITGIDLRIWAISIRFAAIVWASLWMDRN